MSKFIPTIGLEIHAELKTKTKMFCHSKHDALEIRPNVNVCPVCLGHPGTLPVINREAVKSVLRLGVALGGELADFTEFDRKNYFYPDIPKGYQISQYKHPLVKGGNLNGVALTRIHLEEDTAKSTHNSDEDLEGYSLLDFNRAGVPLMELVTEPVIRTASEAQGFARELQLVLQYLDISEANMEKGEMRVEVNLSVSRGKTLGTKVEIKNINSFKAVGQAIEYEFQRQVSLLENGGKVIQETRGWNEEKGITFAQRTKESAHDYRYFPDPDLPKLFISDISDFGRKVLEESLPELPWSKRKRYKDNFNLPEADIEIYVREREWGEFFEKVSLNLGDLDKIKLASNYIISDLKKLIPVSSLVEVIKMISARKISSRGAKDLLRILETEDGEPEQIAGENNLLQESNLEELMKVAKKIIESHPLVVKDYKGGKTESLQFLIGQAMKETGGRGNPKILKECFLEII